MLDSQQHLLFCVVSTTVLILLHLLYILFKSPTFPQLI